MSESHLLKTYFEFPFEITKGRGTLVFDTEGQQYLDLYGGHAVCGIGHSHPRLIEAIKTQAEKLSFYSNLTPLEIRTQAAAKLVEFANTPLTSVFFCNSGAEANENALKLSILLTGRSKLVALKGGFHGRTTMASSVTDNPAWHNDLHDWLGEIELIEANNISEVQEIDQDTAAVILEPIQSMAGVIELSEDYLQAVRERTMQVGGFLIYDEVQTGVGRTGVPYMASTLPTPDMFTSAKSLGGGFPVGALVVSEEIAHDVTIGKLGSTFGGGPMAMAALLATLEVIESESLVENAKEIGEYAKTLLDIPQVTDVRGKGCLLGIKVEANAYDIYNSILEKGVIAGLSKDPNVFRLLPPLCVTTGEIDQFKDVLASALNEAS